MKNLRKNVMIALTALILLSLSACTEETAGTAGSPQKPESTSASVTILQTDHSEGDRETVLPVKGTGTAGKPEDAVPTGMETPKTPSETGRPDRMAADGKEPGAAQTDVKTQTDTKTQPDNVKTQPSKNDQEPKPENTQQAQKHVHSYSQQTRVEASCTENGYVTLRCACGATKKGETLPAVGHEWGAWTETAAATTAAEGEQRRTCSRCGLTEIESIDRLPVPDISGSAAAAYGNSYAAGCGAIIDTGLGFGNAGYNFPDEWYPVSQADLNSVVVENVDLCLGILRGYGEDISAVRINCYLDYLGDSNGYPVYDIYVFYG